MYSSRSPMMPVTALQKRQYHDFSGVALVAIFESVTKLPCSALRLELPGFLSYVRGFMLKVYFPGYASLIRPA